LGVTKDGGGKKKGHLKQEVREKKAHNGSSVQNGNRRGKNEKRGLYMRSKEKTKRKPRRPWCGDKGRKRKKSRVKFALWKVVTDPETEVNSLSKLEWPTGANGVGRNKQMGGVTSETQGRRCLSGWVGDHLANITGTRSEARVAGKS